MLSKQELNPKNHKLTPEQEKNQDILLNSINKIRKDWGKPMTVTSGVRSKNEHIEIYKKIAEKKKKPFDINKVPMGSKHLIGAAVDIFDPDGELYAWCKANEKSLDNADLYCEEDTKGWVHFQCIAFESYKKGDDRFFKP